MKLCFKQLFLLSIICAPFLFLNSSIDGQFQRKSSSNNGVTNLDGEVNVPVGDMMLADGTANGEERGGNVLLSGTGYINLTINDRNGELKFEVCKDECTGISTICYEAINGFKNDNAHGSCSSSTSCEFKVDCLKEADAIYFGKTQVRKRIFTSSCVFPSMTYPDAWVFQESFESCVPKIDPHDKTVQLYIEIPSSSPIKVLNAAVHVPKVLSTLSPTMPKPKETTPSSPAQESSADASFPWWGYLCIGLVILVAAIAICIVVYIICFKKRQSSKAAQPPVCTPATTPITAVSNQNVTTPAAAPAAVASNDTPSSKRKTNLNFTKFEPTIQSKKGKKKKTKKVKKATTTTQEPSSTEDAPPPPYVSKKPVLTQTKPSPTVYGKAPRLVPRSMKSAKTDSLDMTLKKDKMEMIESVIDSVERNCLKSSDSEMVQDMKARESEQKLSDTGCKFDENRRITFVSSRGRKLLQKQRTHASTVYFAFGAEYHRLISDKDFKSYSIPLLMVFVLQTRFSDQIRRKACAMMRRKIPIVLGNFTEAARRKMAFPLNVIEDAYCREPKMFRNLSAIQTDSEDYRRKKQVKEDDY